MHGKQLPKYNGIYTRYSFSTYISIFWGKGVQFEFVDCGTVQHRDTDLPLIALAQSFCLTVPSQKIQVRDLLNKIVSENETEGKKKRVKETLRDLSLCLPLQFCPICLNCLADLFEKKAYA